jgi:hypothetical protein
MASAVLQPADANYWFDWVTNYDQTLANFNAAFNQLVSNRDWIAANHPEMLAQHDALIAEGQGHIDTLNALKATRDYVMSWLNWLWSPVSATVDFTTTAAQSIYNEAKAALGLGALGLAPIVAVAGVAAAAAVLITIGYYIQKAVALNQREEFIKSQEAAGASPQQAANIADQTLGPVGGSINDNLLGIPWTWLIVGAVLVFLGPPLIEAFEGRGGRREYA